MTDTSFEDEGTSKPAGVATPGGASDVKIRDDVAPDALDFSTEPISPRQPPTPQVGGRYDPRPHEDNARRNIAYALIGLLSAVIMSTLLLLGLNVIEVEDLKEFGVVVGPLVALVSAATGFYYGTKSAPPHND